MITKAIAQKILTVVDKGLCEGLDDGELSKEDRPLPGHMCVEAAVCYAFGEKHGDRPKCVDYEVATLKIFLNDYDGWRNNKDRAKNLRRLAIAQLGSKEHFKKKGIKKEFAILFLTAIHKHFIAAKIKTEAHDDETFTVTGPIPLELFLERYDDLADLLENITIGYGPISEVVSREDIVAFCEEFVQILVKLKVPGTKFLYLTATKLKTKKKK